MFAYDIRRFNKNLIGSKLQSQLKCPDSYTKNYGVVYLKQDEHVSGKKAEEIF